MMQTASRGLTETMPQPGVRIYATGQRVTAIAIKSPTGSGYDVYVADGGVLTLAVVGLAQPLKYQIEKLLIGTR